MCVEGVAGRPVAAGAGVVGGFELAVPVASGSADAGAGVGSGSVDDAGPVGPVGACGVGSGSVDHVGPVAADC